MAEQLQAIQRRIKSIESTEKIANAMQLVAAAKLKQSTNRFNYCRNHLNKLAQEFEARIYDAEPETDIDSYTGDHEIAPSLTIVITGSKGMCGSYNSSIIKELDKVEAMTSFLPLGAKGYEHLKSNDLPLLYEADRDFGEENFEWLYNMPPDELTYGDILNLAKKLDDMQRRGLVAEIHLVYAKYKNSMAYDVVNQTIAPVYNIDRKPELEPLIEEYLALTIYNAISEAALNEYGARRLAMKNASDNAEEMLSDLEMKYHRARQAEITDELIEIISGTESQRNLKKVEKKQK